jgi:hypothetical protein
MRQHRDAGLRELRRHSGSHRVPLWSGSSSGPVRFPVIRESGMRIWQIATSTSRIRVRIQRCRAVATVQVSAQAVAQSRRARKV